MRLIWPERAQGEERNRDWLQSRLGFVWLLVILALGALLAAVAVDQSSAALPGDALYPVKQLAEQTALFFTFSAIDKAKQHVQLINERVYDLVALITLGRYEDVPAGVDAFRSEIDNAAEAFRVVAENNQSQGLAFVQQVERSLNDNAVLLSTLALAGPPNAQPIIRTAVQAAIAGKSVLRAQLPSAALAALNGSDPVPTVPPVAATALALPTATPSASASPTAPLNGTPTATATASASPLPSATRANIFRPTSVHPTLPPAVVPTDTAGAPPGSGHNPPPAPSQTNAPIVPPTGTGRPLAPTPTPRPTIGLLPTNTREPTRTKVPTNTPPPTHTKEPTKPPPPTQTKVPTNTPPPTHTKEPTKPPPPTQTPKPTDAPKPTPEPKPTKVPHLLTDSGLMAAITAALEAAAAALVSDLEKLWL